MKKRSKTAIKLFASVLATLLLLTISNPSSAQKANTADYFKIEDYYKIKWGYADEFIALWKKNHYPLLKKLLEKGDVISIEAETPKLHSSEESRWDLKVSVVFKTAKLAFDYSIVDPYKLQLFPDQEAYKKEEQRRWEIVLAHWDVTVENLPLN
ncbi:hypothetical protein [Mucilaginibacter sp. FT3.2]|uniref:hypothetical protein n=1 Tax=Mucilaginibacter sp. FT3.2 TaxID=2723090 RepID=UPI0016072E73|nr:hypothetical protein [Mucilaginibacter sp. FT3.2]MBB6233615.1 hypothetical protein [Mucilaginibacter sp. FT3.2]